MSVIDEAFGNFIAGMANSAVHNYIVPGLRSSLIGGRATDTASYGSCVRLFEATRVQHDSITPHSHRFDFHCVVLRGSVKNRVWERDNDQMDARGGDLYVPSRLIYTNQGPGLYETEMEQLAPARYTPKETLYIEGDTYSMTHDQIHSIKFDRGARVLFFEGPTKHGASMILEPYVNGKRLPTFEVRPWMFQS